MANYLPPAKIWSIKSDGLGDMNKKVVDLLAYRIEKSLKQNGFEIREDLDKKVKLVIKLQGESGVTDGR